MHAPMAPPRMACSVTAEGRRSNQEAISTPAYTDVKLKLAQPRPCLQLAATSLLLAVTAAGPSGRCHLQTPGLWVSLVCPHFLPAAGHCLGCLSTAPAAPGGYPRAVCAMAGRTEGLAGSTCSMGAFARIIFQDGEVVSITSCHGALCAVLTVSPEARKMQNCLDATDCRAARTAEDPSLPHAVPLERPLPDSCACCALTCMGFLLCLSLCFTLFLPPSCMSLNSIVCPWETSSMWVSDVFSVSETLCNCRCFHFLALAYSVLRVDLQCDVFTRWSVNTEVVFGI